MKKTLLSLLAAALTLPAAAQFQVGNSDFESWGSDNNEPGSGWYSFSSASTNGLNGIIANLAKSTSKSTLTKTTGRGGTGNAASLQSKNLSLAAANGNLTTGQINMGSSTPANSGNYNYTNRTSANNKCLFSGRPDAFEYWATFQRGTIPNGSNSATDYNGRCHVIIHGDINYKDPYETAANEAAYKIAEATVYAAPTTTWTKFSGEFTYTGVESSTSYVLASFTTNETPGGSYNDVFNVDDIRFVYYSQLKSLAIDGVSVPGFDKDTYDYTVDQVYTEGTTVVTAEDNTFAGVATVEGSYDAATAVYTITVKGQNISEEADNFHTYTIQFAKPAVAAASLASVSVGGIDVALEDGVYDYTLPFAYSPGIAVEAEAAEGGTIQFNEAMAAMEIQEPAIYDDAAKTITVSVANSENEVTAYTFSFTDAKEETTIGGTYSGALSVVLGTSGMEMTTPLDNTNITLTENQDGTINIQLKNFQFSMMGMNVGDIYVTSLDYEPSTGLLSGTRNVRLASDDPSAIGLYLGHLPVSVSMMLSDTDNKVADATIDIITSGSSVDMVKMFDKIHVDFVPFQIDPAAASTLDEESGVSAFTEQTITGTVTKASTQFLQINNAAFNVPMTHINLTGATIAADVTADDLKQAAPADNNTIYYVPASANSLAGANVVVGGTAQEFAINDAVTMEIPTDFTASSISYNRSFTAGNWSTFALPVSISANALNGKAYELVGINGDAFEFAEVEAIEANKPYLVQLDGESLFLSNVEGAVATCNADTEIETVGEGVKQLGSYKKVTISSTPAATYYGYSAGQFVKAGNNATLNPYRTAFLIDGAASAPAFRLGFQQTGISAATLSVDNAAAYDLQGRRVQNAKNGMFIIGGKKVILK